MQEEVIKNKLQLFRLAADESARHAAYSQVLDLGGAGDARDLCTFLLKCHEGAETSGNFELVVDILNTFHSFDKACLEITSSPSLSQLLTSFQSLGSNAVHKLILEVLLRCHVVKKVPISGDLLRRVVHYASAQICSDSIGLSDVSGKLVEAIVRESKDKDETDGLMREFVDTSTASALNSSGVPDSVMSTRYCGVMARILGTKNRDDLFEASLAHGAVKQILGLCENSKDPLLQMNALELIEEFGGTSAGFNYLQDNGTLLWLLKIAQPDYEGDDSMLGPLALTSLSAVLNRALSSSVLTREMFRSQRSDSRVIAMFMEVMVENIQSSSANAKMAGFSAIVEFSTSSPEAFHAICENKSAIETIMDMVRSPKVEVKVAAFHGLAQMVGFKFDTAAGAQMDSVAGAGAGAGAGDTVFQLGNGTAQNESMSAVLFHEIGRLASNRDTLAFLLGVLQQPFSEIRFAVMLLINAVASFNYGLQLLFHSTSAAAFHEFLERPSEHDKQGKEAKYGIILSIANNPNFGLLSEDKQKLILAAKARGPFYTAPVLAEPQVI
jgi:hypothetical protein